MIKHQKAGKPLVDVRSPGEFTGEMLHMPDYPQEGALARRTHPRRGERALVAGGQRRRHVQDRARNWRRSMSREAGLKRRAPVIAYCRIGERSSHTWFVLHYLLGYPKVKNYDGSWTEWGNTVGVPIEKGEGQPATDVAEAPAEAAGSGA